MNKEKLMALLLLMLFTFHGVAQAEVIRVAAATNFRGAMTEIADLFENESGHEIVLSFASTGKHYAQISNGAPFDLFFAADSNRPRLLEQEGIAIPGSRFVYAVGAIALWSATPEFVDPEGKVLGKNDYRHLALANPDLAPYGQAAKEVLIALGYWQMAKNKLVMGENIGQAFQFVATGNAEIGFIALSQLLETRMSLGGSAWRVPQSLHAPIVQEAVLLSGKGGARELVAFSRSAGIREILIEHGYEQP